MLDVSAAILDNSFKTSTPSRRVWRPASSASVEAASRSTEPSVALWRKSGDASASWLDSDAAWSTPSATFCLEHCATFAANLTISVAAYSRPTTPFSQRAGHNSTPTLRTSHPQPCAIYHRCAPLPPS